MNSQHKTLLIASILAFALIANVNVGNVYATGGLDDEEEEEAIEQLQNSVEELENTIGTIELNLTEGANEIEANCPISEDIVEEVKEVVQNVTEQIPTCPLVPAVAPSAAEQNVTEPAAEQPAEVPICPFVEPPAVIEQNITEQIEEIIQNVTDEQPICNIPQDIIPGIVLPELNVTEPEEPVQNNETQVVVEGCQPVPEPEVQNETSDLVPIICPINGELLGYTNTTSGEQLPISAGEQQQQQPEQQQPALEQNVTETAPEQQQQPTSLQDEQEIATIEFEASCGCFVVDKTPEEV
jgi:hypothetical protein